MSIRKNILRFLGVPDTFTASASLPLASLGGSPPEVQLVRPAQAVAVAPSATAAPVVATAPRFRKAPVDAEGFTGYQRKMQVEARLKTEFNFHGRLEAAGMDTKARRRVLSDFDAFVAARPLGKAAPAPESLTVDDEGNGHVDAPVDDPENPPGIDSIISQLLDLVLELKKQLQITADDDDEVQGALALFASKKKLSASRALMAATQKMCTRPKLSPRAKTARGFNSQSGVAALNGILSRTAPGQRPAASAPTVPTTPAVPAVAGSRSRVQEHRAEISALDREQRKQFSNERNAKHAQLSAQLRVEMKKFSVS